MRKLCILLLYLCIYLSMTMNCYADSKETSILDTKKSKQTLQTQQDEQTQHDEQVFLSLNVYSKLNPLPWATPISHYKEQYHSVARLRSALPKPNNLTSDSLNPLTDQKQMRHKFFHPRLRKILPSRDLLKNHPIWTFKNKISKAYSLSHNWNKSAAGFLLNALQLNDHLPYWVTRRYKNYATPETIYAIQFAVAYLHKKDPKSPPLVIGDLSKRYGGHFPPHASHQSGRDADIAYFVKKVDAPHQLMKVTPRSMHVARTWFFLEGLLKTQLIESIYIDYKLQRKLYYYAKKSKALTSQELKKYFSYPSWKTGTIKHLKGHDDHMHVRFKAPQSMQVAQHYLKLKGSRQFKPRPIYRKVRKSENLFTLARKLRISWKRLASWNHISKLKALRLKVGQRLLIGYRTPYQVREIQFDVDQIALHDILP
jgi:hypothetical protein